MGDRFEHHLTLAALEVAGCCREGELGSVVEEGGVPVSSDDRQVAVLPEDGLCRVACLPISGCGVLLKILNHFTLRVVHSDIGVCFRR